MHNKIKVGIFTFLGLGLIFFMSVMVNDKPYWWKTCQLVHISVEDASGLKTKSPVRSLGIHIGYLKTLELSDASVRLGICITASVDLTPETRAYIRSEGFLGDKSVELKPVKYLGKERQINQYFGQPRALIYAQALRWWSDQIWSKGFAQTPPASGGGREVPMGASSKDMQAVMNSVDGLVKELKGLTSDINTALNPATLRKTMQQLNLTLDNASKSLNPQSGLTATAQRSLAKLEDAIEQLRDMMTRINQGKGSVGLLLNDPVYAEEIRDAIHKVNKLLAKVDDVRFNIDIGADYLGGWAGTRGWFKLAIWPAPNRYYLVGLSSDARGTYQSTVTTTSVNGVQTVVNSTVLTQGGMSLIVMLGRVLWNRVDVALGLLYGDVAFSMNLRLGPDGSEQRIQIQDSVYSRFQGLAGGASLNRLDNRLGLYVMPVGPNVYLRAGLDSMYQVNGQVAWSAGGGVTVDDEDIKLLFALK